MSLLLILKKMTMEKLNNLNKKVFFLTGVFALIYALIPVIMDIPSMQEHFISLFLILIAFLNTGVYVLIEMYFNNVFVKVLFIVVSFLIFWFLFYRWYIRRLSKKQKIQESVPK